MKNRALAIIGGGVIVAASFFFNTMFVLGAPVSRNFEIKSLPHQTGSLESDGSFKAVEGANAAGFLSYGPRVDLEPGNYNVTFTVNCDSKGTNYADITSDAGKNALGKKVFACGSRKEGLSIPFQLKQKATGVEFRVFYGGKGAIQLVGLRLEQR